MSLRIGNRLFAPPGWGVALAALGLAAFVTLGSWQLGRASEKQALADTFAAGGRQTVDAPGLRFHELAR